MKSKREKIAISISDDIVTDGLTNDRLYDITKRILALNEFIGSIIIKLKFSTGLSCR
jgi:hypothetical protein